jgi:hypothetical protein
VAFLVRPAVLEAALVLLSTVSALPCRALLLPALMVAVVLSPSSALWLLALVLRPTGLRDCRLFGCLGGELA